MKNRIHWS